MRPEFLLCNFPVTKILAAWDPKQFREMSAPFRERYPDVKINYTRGSLTDRGIKTLVAYQGGRYVADVISSSSNTWIDFKAMDGLTDLRALPNYKLLPKENRDADGMWIGQKITYRCMAYNTNKFKKSDLPKTWDDIITNPIWRNGNIAIPDIPSIWLTMLWDAKGEAWTTNFMTKLFKEVKPQLRKEGLNANVSLAGAGEMMAALPTSGYRTRFEAEKGAPVSFHCPEPVPGSTNEMAIMRNAPDNNAAHLFMNWALSKEGQVSQFNTDGGSPTHKAFQNDDRFIAYSETIAGKAVAFRTPELLADNGPRVIEFWNASWAKMSR